MGTDTVAIPARGGRAGREAKVALAAARVWIPAPTQPASEWIVVTSVESETLEPLKERRDWDACRWRVEVYHDVEKNGCGREARRFETADRMAACLAILSVVAVRVFALRTALDHPPQAGAAAVASREEVTVWSAAVGVAVKSVADFVRGVARLGGFLGRKPDGNPGVETLWRGDHRLPDFILGYRCRAKLRPKDVGNR